MEPRISIITLGVDDLKKSKSFYEALGLPAKNDHIGIIFIELIGTWLALYPKELLALDANIENDASGFSGFTLAHNVKSKNEVDELMKTAISAGAVVTDTARDREWGGYSGYFKDPDGYLWEIAWNPHLPELADFSDE